MNVDSEEEKMRKTKVVITVGPALWNGGPLRECLAIADVIRLNASHTNCEERTRVIKEVRETLCELGRDIPIFVDLQGPKWRIGLMPEPIELEVGAVGALYPMGQAVPEGLAWAAPLPHPELFKGARVGQTWLLDDGALSFEIVEAQPELLKARVVVGGLLKPRKGIHPIGLDVIFDPLTPKDLEDIRWGVEQGVDLFAMSFVRRAEDLHALQTLINELGGRQGIIAKIEHPQALDNLDAILAQCWGVMVARGDLGVELGVAKVPALQKRIIRKARMALKPVITATQMLESMIEHPQPTRAEASDVANAIWDGTDAVMLSAESAAGKFPLEAVQFLAKIAEEADEHHRPRIARFAESLDEKVMGRTDVSVAFAACRTAEAIGAKLIVVFTEGGGSARMVSRLAGNIPVVGATTDKGNARRLQVLRGVQTLLIPKAEHMSQMEASIYPQLRSTFNLQPGDRVVMTLGHPLWTIGTTNTMKVVTF